MIQFIITTIYCYFQYKLADAGDAEEERLEYTGSFTSDRNELDVISLDNRMAVFFETDDSFTKTGFILQITSVPSYFNGNNSSKIIEWL